MNHLEPVPAGDAGRPYGTPAEENAWDVANELRTENARLRDQLAAQQAVGDAAQDERERILTTLRQYGATSGQYVHPWYVPALFDALAYLVENTPVAQAAGAGG